MSATNPWITYRTRFLVKAKQLTTSLAFTDILGRQHTGRKGDYLVESSDGILRIAPRQIFEDIYVPLPPEEAEFSDPPKAPAAPLGAVIPALNNLLFNNPGRTKPETLTLPTAMGRKSPQPCRERHNCSPGIRSL